MHQKHNFIKMWYTFLEPKDIQIDPNSDHILGGGRGHPGTILRVAKLTGVLPCAGIIIGEKRAGNFKVSF